MKYPWCFILLHISICTNAQNSYRATYTRDNQTGFTINGSRTFHTDYVYYMFFNDSVSFTFVSTDRNEKWRKYCKTESSKVLHHSAFYKKSTNTVYHGVAYPSNRKPFFIKDSLIENTFQIDPTIKKFKKWHCKEAFVELSKGDTLFALLAIDYPYPFEPLNFIKFPYVPLEIYIPSSDFHLVIKDIKEDIFEIFIPTGIPIIAKEEYNKRLFLKKRD